MDEKMRKKIINLMFRIDINKYWLDINEEDNKWELYDGKIMLETGEEQLIMSSDTHTIKELEKWVKEHEILPEGHYFYKYGFILDNILIIILIINLFTINEPYVAGICCGGIWTYLINQILITKAQTHNFKASNLIFEEQREKFKKELERLENEK